MNNWREKFKELFRLTRREYLADFWITPPLTVGLAIISLHGGFGVGWLIFLTLGLLTWTLYEYGVHRWILHGGSVFADIHNLHHDKPLDYIAMPPWATVTFYLVTWLVVGIHASAIAVGFSVGYVMYASLHTMFHFNETRVGDPMFRLHRRHAIHHRLHWGNYGVIVDWWDRLLRTEVRDIKRKSY